jgi:glycosyltransferase involved in cell wall biosynthesis
MPRVSVVVPTFERAARLPGLIAALEAQTLSAGDFDVIIADDGSSDDTPTVLADLAARARINLRVVKNPVNRGPGAARNLGWRSSDAPIIAFTDDDCVPAPHWLEAGLAGFERSSAGIVQGRTLPDPGVSNRGWTKTLTIDRLSSLYQSCNIFYLADVLRAVDGFDEEIRVPFGEDTAIGWKARRLDVGCEFAPEALVHHSVTRPGVGYWWRYAMMHRNFATLVRRFPEMRREMLWWRVFIWRNHAVFVAAAAGAIAGIVWRPAFALVIPYAYLRRPRRLGREEIVASFQGTAFDAAILAGLAIGSVRERTIVL